MVRIGGTPRRRGCLRLRRRCAPGSHRCLWSSNLVSAPRTRRTPSKVLRPQSRPGGPSPLGSEHAWLGLLPLPFSDQPWPLYCSQPAPSSSEESLMRTDVCCVTLAPVRLVSQQEDSTGKPLDLNQVKP